MNKSLEICAGIIAALLGIAYPILTEVIGNLNEKYSWNTIVDLFIEEKFYAYILQDCRAQGWGRYIDPTL